MVYLSVVFDH